MTNFAITHEYRNSTLRADGYSKGIEVNTKKAVFRDIPWKLLGKFGKRKFENVLVLRETDNVKILYA
jgi:hypothetical protein